MKWKILYFKTASSGIYQNKIVFKFYFYPMTKTFSPFLIMVLSIFILLCAPALFTEGMFMDGLMYATVAKNLAHGEGSFWFLKFSDTYLTSFHEHPPLIFGLQSFYHQNLQQNIVLLRIVYCHMEGLFRYYHWYQSTLS